MLISQDPIPTTFKMKLYRAKDLSGFPLKIDVENPMTRAKFTITYSDVSLEPPDAKLFERPAKCDSPILKPLTQPESKPKPAKPAANLHQSRRQNPNRAFAILKWRKGRSWLRPAESSCAQSESFF